MPSLSTPTDICNLALSELGQRTITSLDDSNELARKCTLFYERMRQDTLRACDWTFARRTVELDLIDQQAGLVSFPDWAESEDDDDTTGDDVPPQWSYFYGYPGTCLFVHKVFDPYHPIIPDPYTNGNSGSLWGNWDKPKTWEVMRSVLTNQLGIATNQANAWARFTQDMLDPSQFDPVFVTALSLKLAQKMCMSLTGDKELKADVDKDLELAMGEAKRLNLSEYPEFAPRDSAYERARDQS